MGTLHGSHPGCSKTTSCGRNWLRLIRPHHRCGCSSVICGDTRTLGQAPATPTAWASERGPRQYAVSVHAYASNKTPSLLVNVRRPTPVPLRLQAFESLRCDVVSNEALDKTLLAVLSAQSRIHSPGSVSSAPLLRGAPGHRGLAVGCRCTAAPNYRRLAGAASKSLFPRS